MKKRTTADSSYTRVDPQGQMYVLRLNGFWGAVVASIALLLILPLVMAFFLFVVVGLLAVAVIGSGYAWWYRKQLRRLRTSDDEDAIELAVSEYQTLAQPGVKAHGTEGTEKAPV